MVYFQDKFDQNIKALVQLQPWGASGKIGTLNTDIFSVERISNSKGGENGVVLIIPLVMFNYIGSSNHEDTVLVLEDVYHGTTTEDTSTTSRFIKHGGVICQDKASTKIECGKDEISI